MKSSSSTLDLTTAQILTENKDLAFIGTQKGGAFEIPADVAEKMLSAGGNPNGRSNSDVIRPWLNGTDITGRPSGKWIIFFGVDMSMHNAALYEKPFEYVRTKVKASREEIRSEERSTLKWWLHQRPRPEMWAALHDKAYYIVTPRVAKHRIFVWAEARTIPDSRLVVIARDDDYFLGVLHSRVHQVWALATSSRHGDGSEGGRPTYNATTCFETFPFPWPPGREPKRDPRVKAIAQVAHELVQQRDAWLNPSGATEAELKKRTLTNLYNERPTWLDLAHRKLDEAVFDAYGWPHDISDEEILAPLLALNLERASGKE